MKLLPKEGFDEMNGNQQQNICNSMHKPYIVINLYNIVYNSYLGEIIL